MKDAFFPLYSYLHFVQDIRSICSNVPRQWLLIKMHLEFELKRYGILILYGRMQLKEIWDVNKYIIDTSINLMMA